MDSFELSPQLKKDKEKILRPVRLKFYLLDDLRGDYFDFLLFKAWVIMHGNFGIEYTGTSEQVTILSDLVALLYEGKQEKDLPPFIMRLLKKESLRCLGEKQQ